MSTVLYCTWPYFSFSFFSWISAGEYCTVLGSTDFPTLVRFSVVSAVLYLGPLSFSYFN